MQETLHFDPVSGRLTSLRSKEEAHDYRYFPEPDLVPLVVSDEMRQALEDGLPELPAARAQRFERELGLVPDRARELAFRREQADYFERAVASTNGGGQDAAVAIANWMPQLMERIGSDADPAQSHVEPGALAALAEMVRAKQVSRDAARDVLTRLVESGGDPQEIVEREGLGALDAGDDDQLGAIVDAALASDPDAARQVKAGNMKAIGPLVGYVMRETKGRADGGEVTRLIRQRLELAG